MSFLSEQVGLEKREALWAVCASAEAEARQSGCSPDDLRAVIVSVRQGLDEVEASLERAKRSIT